MNGSPSEGRGDYGGLPATELASLKARWRAEGLHADETIPQMLARAARERGDVSRAFHSDERETRTITLAEAYELSRDWAARLQALGVGPGDTVAVQMPNWWEAWVFGYAVLTTGARILPIHFTYVGPDLDYALRESRAKVLFMAERSRGLDCLDRIPALESLPALETILVQGERAAGKAKLWRDVLAGPAPDFQEPQLHPDDVCILLFTSGTTSRPKGVLHTHNTMLAEGRTFFTRRRVDPDNPTLLTAAVYGHIGCMIDLVRGPLSGFCDAVRDRWEARECLELIGRYKVSGMSGTPFHLLGLLDMVDRGLGDISSLKYFSMGATTISPTHIQTLEDRGIRATRVYGSTEHPTVCSGDPNDPLQVRATNEGRVLPGIEVRIVDDDGSDVAGGEAGELVTRGPELCVGYMHEDHNRNAWLPGGWFRTGDIATMSAGGYITIVDRKKDIIIRGGENLSSKEIEDALVLHCGAREAAVVAFPDERYGERVCAFIIPHSPSEISLEQIRAQFAAAGLAKQKAPERVEVVEDFPRTALGKIKKAELRDWLKATAEAEAG
ncbi:AMP-binding protein [Phenylobacterium sp.]|uniref:class I adenylate-forming enzyme family protein n=1 Tax=Phenylobacterium sp. TaxID=1871053 RepID=UPI00301DF43D